jgi:hypothetical protein
MAFEFLVAGTAEIENLGKNSTFVQNLQFLQENRYIFSVADAL